MKKRPMLDPEEVDNYFQITDEPARKPTPYDAQYAHRTYRVAEKTHRLLIGIASAKGVGLNELVRWIFRRFIEDYTAGKIELPVTEDTVTRKRLT